MESLLHFDEWLFTIINGSWRSDWLDLVAPTWRNKYFWIPFYLFVLALVGFNFKKLFFPFLICAVLTVTVADTLSSKIIKPAVKRERPCKNEHLAKPAVVLVNCGSGYSFTSSHATNHFAIAIFFLLTIGSVLTYSKVLLVLWAASISYGQVYVGVHYPLDVLFGAIQGIIIGLGFGIFFKSRWPFHLQNIDPIT